MIFQQLPDVHEHQRVVHRPRTWIRPNKPQNNRERMVGQVGTSFRLFFRRFMKKKTYNLSIGEIVLVKFFTSKLLLNQMFIQSAMQ